MSKLYFTDFKFTSLYNVVRVNTATFVNLSRPFHGKTNTSRWCFNISCSHLFINLKIVRRTQFLKINIKHIRFLSCMCPWIFFKSIFVQISHINIAIEEFNIEFHVYVPFWLLNCFSPSKKLSDNFDFPVDVSLFIYLLIAISLNYFKSYHQRQVSYLCVTKIAWFFMCGRTKILTTFYVQTIFWNSPFCWSLIQVWH